MEERGMQMLEFVCVCGMERHGVMMLATFQNMTMLWIKNGNAGAIPLSHTGLVRGILVNNMPVNLEYKQLFKMFTNSMNIVKRGLCAHLK